MKLHLVVFAVVLLQLADFALGQNLTVGPPLPPELACRPKKCRTGEIFSCCGTCVQKTCLSLREPDVQCFACAVGCFCPAGFVRKFPGGPCVTIKSCARFLVNFFSSG